MKAKLVIAVASLQLVVLVFMAAQRECVVRFGRTVYLRTMPIDPRDIFRGDYVRLRYEISDLSSEFWQDDLDAMTNNTGRRRRGQDKRVYTVLDLDDNGVGIPRYVTGERPDEDLFVRGRTDRVWGNRMTVRYGLEAFFVEQGKGLELERGRTRDDRMRIPLEMEVAVARSGMAVLKDYRWCPVGLALNIETDKERRPTAAKLKLLNASDKPLAIVDLPGGRSFTLERDMWTTRQNNDWRWVGEGTPPPVVSDEYVVVLQPDESHEIVISFNDTAWFVKRGKEEPRSLSDPERRRWQRFRFVYRPPSREGSSHLRDADLIWHGRMYSSAFAGANVD